MDLKEAKKIYGVWKEHFEIFDKLGIVFNSLPGYFLPYSKEVIEEAINLVIKEYYENGNQEMAHNIKTATSFHLSKFYMNDSKTDEDILNNMHKNLSLILQNPEYMNVVIKALKENQENWILSRK